MMSTPLHQGIPAIESYNDVLKSELFRGLEEFSNQFLDSHRSAIREYRRRWVPDPLHQWSRQWEYPFVYSYIRGLLDNQTQQEMAILDAGSGVTFFPFYLASKFPGISVDCCDMDSSLKAPFASINAKVSFPVGFHSANLGQLPFKDETFDVIYCISVLEHTEAFDAILQEFSRISRPSGMLIITFDISLDGSGEIDPRRATELVETAEQYFHPVRHFNAARALEKLKDRATILTTRCAARKNRKLLPWRQSRLFAFQTLLRLQRPDASCRNLTCFCQVLRKE